MFLCRDTIPLGHGVALLIEQRYLFLPREKCVRFNDVVKVADDGDGRLGIAARAEVPLQVANPENEIGNDRCAWIKFETQELVRVHGEAGVFERLLRVAKRVEGFKNLALQAFHVFKRDIEEVPGAARGIEDAGGAKLAVKCARGFNGSISVTCVDLFGDNRLAATPVVPEWLYKSWND